MITAISRIAEIDSAKIKLKSISAIAGERFPYDRYNRLPFFSDRSDHMETGL